MPWQVRRIEELGIIETVYTGRITKADSNQATAQALSLTAGTGPYLFLSDIANARSQLSVMEIYDVPSEWEAAGADRRTRLAVVATEDSAAEGLVEFYEHVTTNRGWRVKVFRERDAAIRWLLKN